jgi:hypothetical protein
MDNAYGVYPIASDRIENPENSLYTAGYLYQHEVGYNDDGSPMESFVESSDIDIDDGENFAFISRIIPDVMFRGTSSTPSIDISLKYRNYPMEAFRNGPTVTVADGDTQKGVRMRGRQMTFRVSSDGSEVGWRLGSNRFQIQPDGQK